MTQKNLPFKRMILPQMHTYKVYLNIYDFTSANKYVSCMGLGGYHTGVEIKYIFLQYSQ